MTRASSWCGSVPTMTGTLMYDHLTDKERAELLDELEFQRQYPISDRRVSALRQLVELLASEVDDEWSANMSARRRYCWACENVHPGGKESCGQA